MALPQGSLPKPDGEASDVEQSAVMEALRNAVLAVAELLVPDAAQRTKLLTGQVGVLLEGRASKNGRLGRPLVWQGLAHEDTTSCNIKKTIDSQKPSYIYRPGRAIRHQIPAAGWLGPLHGCGAARCAGCTCDWR